MKKKILIVDDEPASQVILSHRLVEMPDKVIVLRATSLAEAKRLFDDNPDIDLIAMDGCVPDPDASPHERRIPNSMNLVRYMRQKYNGPIFGVSDQFNDRLRSAGCDNSCSKDLFSYAAIVLLRLQS